MSKQEMIIFHCNVKLHKRLINNFNDLFSHNINALTNSHWLWCEIITSWFLLNLMARTFCREQKELQLNKKSPLNALRVSDLK